MAEAVIRAAQEKLDEGCKVGILASEELADRYRESLAKRPDKGANAVIEIVGSRQNEESVAANLFDKLRGFDEEGAEFMFGECFASDNLGAAIMNRLVKAAGYHIEKV